jgi:hypothetical protein
MLPQLAIVKKWDGAAHYLNIPGGGTVVPGVAGCSARQQNAR